MSDSYAGLPSAPPPPPGGSWQQQPVQPPRPSTVTRAFVLMLVHCAFAAVSIVITAANADELKRKVLDNTPTASKSTLDSVVPIAIGIGVVFLLLYLALALVVRAGKNWARIVTWVLAGLSILSGLVSLGQPTITSTRVISVIVLLVDIAIVVLLALKPSNAYFRKAQPQYG